LGDDLLDFIVFSRNRPIQLHALLSSLREFATGEYRVRVLHRYDGDYVAPLKEVRELHRDVEFIDESKFREQVIELVTSSTEHCAFLVDDIIFKESFEVERVTRVLQENPSILCFSLRLGLHLDYCFPTDSKMRIPNGNVMDEMFAWQWKGASYDWGYPLSVDGHVFRRDQILDLTKLIPFKNPNEFEAALQFVAGQIELPHCVSFVRSPLLNVPMNRVQDEFKNRCLDISAEELNEAWISGKEIDRSRLISYINHGAHEPINLSFKERN